MEVTTPRLRDQVRAAIRVRHDSIRTEEAYVHWVRRFVLFHGKRHPLQMSERDVAAFLSDLASVGRVAPVTRQRQREHPGRIRRFSARGG